MQVIKVGGNELDTPGFIEQLAATIHDFNESVIVVHGGGKAITEMQARYGIQPRYLDGLRITDEESMELVKTVLCGMVNPRIVQVFQQAGLEAQGFSGIDRGLIQAKKLFHPTGDPGRVGEVASVRSDILQETLNKGVTPIIAPICLGDDGGIFNVNADHVGGGVAAAMNASQMVFLTNVPGVLQDKQLIDTLTPALADELIQKGIINGGMIPKVKTALSMVEKGVQQVMITNLDGLRNQTGTIVKQS